MRPATETATAARNVTLLHPPPASTTATSSCDPQAHSCKWWPYSSSGDFEANTVMIILFLLCALICSLALNTAIRWFLTGGGNRSEDRQQELAEQEKPNAEAGTTAVLVAQTLVYTPEMKLGGAEADCAICLSDFAEGELVRVLGRCNHGFHAYCVEQWLSRHYSCPTCRSSCLATTSDLSEKPKTANLCPDNGVNENRIHQPSASERAPEHHIASLVPPDLPV